MALSSEIEPLTTIPLLVDAIPFGREGAEREFLKRKD